MQITGIILSGGQSTRMGTDKALLLLNGKTLLENAIDICKSICNKIIISSNNPAHGKFGYQTVHDEKDNCGPLGGIYSCLKKSDSNLNVVISVDVAFIKQEFIKFLIDNAGQSDDAVIPIHDKGKEPLIAIYHKNCIAVMEKQLKSGDYKMQNLLSVIHAKYIDSQHWVETFPKIFCNLNRPEDFIV